jgi:hypothetical protein
MNPHDERERILYIYIYIHVSLYISMIYTHMITLLYLHATSKIPDDLPPFFLLRYFLFLYFQLGTHAYLFVDEAEGEARLIGYDGNFTIWVIEIDYNLYKKI